MKILIIRHGDPDYAADSLTPVGWQEAELLADRLEKVEISNFYVSPLGRARDTASCTIKRKHAVAEVCDWLQEFPPKLVHPGSEGVPKVVWDWIPEGWTSEPRFFDAEAWRQVPVMQEANVGACYDYVTESFDTLLQRHGYVRTGKYYKAMSPNHETIALFCHFGLECVLLSHLMNVSPMILWHSFCAAPTSVTSIISEERREGIAYFRASSLGDVSHLYIAGCQPSFSARFCECFTDSDQRHD